MYLLVWSLSTPQAKHEQLSAYWKIMITSLVISVIEEETMQAAAQAEVMEGSHESYVLLLGGYHFTVTVCKMGLDNVVDCIHMGSLQHVESMGWR